MKNTQPEIDIAKLESRCDAVNEKLTNLEVRIGIVEEKQNKLESRADLLDARLKPAFTIGNIFLGVIASAVAGALVILVANQIAKG